MMRTSLVVAIAVLFAGMVSAAPVDCTGFNLGQVIAEADGCLIGDKVFSDFTYVFSGGATPLPATSVSFTPQPLPYNPGFQLNGGWNAAAGTTADVYLSFLVTGPGIKDASLGVGGFTGQGIAIIDGNEELCLGAAWPDAFGDCPTGDTAQMNVNFSGPSGNDAIDWFDAVGPVSVVGVRKDIALINLNTSALRSFSIITQNFSQVPEPTTMLLMGSGLLALGLVRRRAIKNRG